MAAALCALTSSAQEAEKNDSLFVQMQSIEVTTTRASDRSPVVHSNLSSDDVARNNYGLDIPALLSLTPSLFSSTETGIALGGTSIRLRGTDATRINVTMNGVEMNDPDSHAVYWYDTPDISSSVGSIQVQRGAGVSTNGTGAFGGAVSMTTAMLSTRLGGDASLSYGSFNTNRQSVHFGSGLLGGHYIVDLRLSHTASDGYIDRANTDMKSYMFQAGYFSRASVLKLISFGGKTKTYLTYNGVSPEDMELYGRRYHTSGQYSCSDGPYILADGTHVNYFNDQTDNYLQINNQLIFDHQFSQNWKMNLTGFYTYGYGYYRQYKDDAWLSGYDNLVDTWDQADLIRQKKMRNHRGGVNASAIYSTSSLELVFGGSYSYYKCPHWGTLDWIDGMDSSLYRDFVWYSSNVRKQDTNLFARASWTVAKGLNLYADLQWRYVGYKAWGTNDNYDWNKLEMQPIDVDKKYSFFNPKVGLKYTFLNRHSIHFSFAIAHKEPTRSDFTDRYNFSSLTEAPVAERMMDWEAGYRFSHPVVDLDVNFYYMSYKNQLVPTGIVNDSDDNLNINVDRSLRRGIELQAAFKPAKWFTLHLGATLSQNRIMDYTDHIGDKEFFMGTRTIAYSPSVIASSAFDFHVCGFEAILRTQYISKQYMTNGNYEDLTLPRYCVSNLNLAYTLKTKAVKSVRFGLLISNLFNKKYCSYGYGGSWLEGDTLDTRGSWSMYFPQATTNVLANVTLSF